jgi:AcrR family transcriptional regulator
MLQASDIEFRKVKVHSETLSTNRESILIYARNVNLEDSVGRLKPARIDSRDTRARLIAAAGELAQKTGLPPTRLADIAEAAGISTATAYRHFASAEEVALAHVLQLPHLAIDRFTSCEKSVQESPAIKRFADWNDAWVHACIVFGPSAAALRSPEGFLARRRRGEPSIALVCEHVEPLLVDLLNAKHIASVVEALIVWNAISDPREVLDMKNTLRWSRSRIVAFITETTTAQTQPRNI